LSELVLVDIDNKQPRTHAVQCSRREMRGCFCRPGYLPGEGRSSDRAASAGPTIITNAAMARPVCVTAKMSA